MGIFIGSAFMARGLSADGTADPTTAAVFKKDLREKWVVILFVYGFGSELNWCAY
ncbi:MAG TPA: hypothetical protein VLJ11_18065 [Bryobacteraceae bacterium]|nr:hypothetical protein [Bryobacteraceae bacterium]